MMSMFMQHQNQVLSVKKLYFRSTDMFKIFLAYKGIISVGVCNFLSSLAMFTTTYKHKNLH